MSGALEVPAAGNAAPRPRAHARGQSAPAPDDRALQARLLARDPLAPSDLAVAHLPHLAAFLRGAFPAVDPDLLDDVAIDLILAVAERPEQYDPDRGALDAYLRMAARGDVKNALRSERRRTERAVSLDADVELSDRLGNTLQDDTLADPADLITRRGIFGPSTRAILLASFNPVELEVVRLMLEGERRTAVYARLLGIGADPAAEQAHQVKQVKDRLQKRLRRLAPKVRRDA